MVKEGIKIFCRIRPNIKTNQVGNFFVKTPETSKESYAISFQIPKNSNDGMVNNKKEVYHFKFNQIFQHKTTQDDVFSKVASPVIDNVIQGYNGTIFAYGQTGSGKTYTMTGGTEKYTDRGIIPRTISYLFEYFKKTSGLVYTLQISYLEIYNEHGFDLLNAEHEASKLEDLPRVSLMEDAQGCIHLRNLSQHSANTTEEALNWLFMGDTNRVIAETPMNMASTRSHCIFTLYITSREPGSDVLRRSKLHLVDLAGSERIGKTGVKGSLLTEAKYINLSLHYLEQVIISLSEKKGHIPYRNSLMTSVLRDSLGGNCMTSMVATCSVEMNSIDESISTCRFAQRVALIKNDALVNEELDPRAMIARLKQQVSELKQDLELVSGSERTEDLTEEEITDCRKAVDIYLDETDPETHMQVTGDMRKIHSCFKYIKEKYMKIQSKSLNKEHKSPYTSPNAIKLIQDEGNLEKHRMGVESDLLNMDVNRLRELLKQRDEEINVLVKLLKQEKENFAETQRSLFILREKYIEVTGHNIELKTICKRPKTDPNLIQRDQSTLSTASSTVRESISEEMYSRKRAELSKARKTAFESFRKSHPLESTITKHKISLSKCFSKAKILGEKVNSSRLAMNKIKAQIQQLRISNALEANLNLEQEEEKLRYQLESHKIGFKSECSALKEFKTEIEHTQHLMEKLKVQIMKDFDVWWSDQVKTRKNSVLESSNGLNSMELSVDFSQSQLNSEYPLHSTCIKPGLKPDSVQMLDERKADKSIENFYRMKHDLLDKRT